MTKKYEIYRGFILRNEELISCNGNVDIFRCKICGSIVEKECHNPFKQFYIDMQSAMEYFFPGKKSVSYKQMCEKIAEYDVVVLKSTGKPDKDPTSIFNYSTTGELMNIPIWFVEAYKEAIGFYE